MSEFAEPITDELRERQFSTLLGAHAESAVRLAYHLTRNREAALDLSQEAFVKALQSIDGLRNKEITVVWYRRILVNVCRDWIRKQAVRRKAAERISREKEQAAQDASSEIEFRDSAKAVRAALLNLPAEYREVLALVAIEGCAQGEAAQILNLPEGTLRWRLHEAKRLMREHLESEF